MKQVTLSIIVPTKGRPELYATLLSILREGYLYGDEVIVVGDGEQPEARRIAGHFSGRMNVKYHETEPTHRFGGHQRNHAISHATGTHLAFIDDDDVYVEGGLRHIRHAVEETPEKIPVFRIRAMAKRMHYDVLWQEPKFCLGNIGTPMFAVPNEKEKLGRWGESRGSDFAFLETTLAKYPEGEAVLLWKDHVVVEVR